MLDSITLFGKTALGVLLVALPLLLVVAGVAVIQGKITALFDEIEYSFL